MKILVAGCRGIPGIPGGIETHCQELYPRLAALGGEITIACRTPYVRFPGGEYRGVKLVKLPSTRIKGAEPFLHTLLAVFYAALRGYKVLHIHGVGPGLLVPLARLLGRHVVFTTHGPDYLRPKWGRLSSLLLRAGEALGCRMAHRVIAISRGIRSHVQEKYNRQDVNLIFNGRTLPERSGKRDFILNLGLEPGKYILTVGRFEAEKGFHDLVAAYERLNSDDLKLVLAGDNFKSTPYCRRLTGRAAACGCLLPGFVQGEPLRQLYSHARVFVLPSYLEGLSLALLEALSYGLDVIASAIGANREVELPPECYFPPGDVNALTRCLRTLPPLSDGGREDYRTIIKERYNWDKLAFRTWAVYREILKPKGKGTYGA